jgi:glycosyltransferase involved in cell wall biosynthesis
MYPTITVIVPVHNGGEQLRRSLVALTQTYPSPDEIIVVVDGGNANPVQLRAEFDVRVLPLQTQVGPARARNYGARHASGEILFFIDADDDPLSLALLFLQWCGFCMDDHFRPFKRAFYGSE